MLQVPAPTRWLAGPIPVADVWRRLRHTAATHILGARRAPRLERRFHADAQQSPLERQLRGLSRRLRTQRVLETAPAAAALAVVVLLAGAVIARVLSLPGLFLVTLVVAPVLFGLRMWGALGQPIGPFETARHADAALHLRERLATALELLDGDVHGLVADRQVSDATAAAAMAEPAAAFPYFAPGSRARRDALRRSGYAAAGLVAVAVLALSQSGSALRQWTSNGQELALADPGADPSDTEQFLRDQLRPGLTNGEEAVTGRTDRPNEVGDLTPGLLGENQQSQSTGSQQDSGSQGGAQDRQNQAEQDARSQQSTSVADRQQALQDLASALRNSQTAKQAAESLKRGDTQRASQQLNQVADQVSKMSPGERSSLASAFQDAASSIGSKDKALADDAKKAGDALSQFRNQDAQQAIRDAANQVKDTGQQAQAQKQLDQRASDLQKGGQPQLPQGQQGAQKPQVGALQQSRDGGQQNSQNGAQQNNQSSSSSPNGNGGELRSGGDQASSASTLSDLESELRNDALGAAAGGQGAGSSQGGALNGAPHRLAVDSRLVTVQAEERDGPTQWRPPSPNAPPAAAPPAAPATGAAASSNPVGGGQDLNNVPWDLTGPVRQYFTPDPAQK